MGGLGLERPPRWGIVVLAILVLVNVALFSVVVLHPNTPAGSGQQAAAAALTSAPSGVPSTPAVVSSAAATAGAPPVLAVYGDGYSAGNDQGGVGDAGWPAQVALATGTTLALSAVAQAGYASIGVSGRDFVGLVEDTPFPDAAVTLLVGSRNDAGEDVAVVAANVAQALDALRRTAPGTTVVLVGPIWDDGDVPADVQAVRDAVRDAATAAGVRFVDPVADGWFADENGLISPDGVSLNDAGHSYVAGLLAPVIREALASAGD